MSNKKRARKESATVDHDEIISRLKRRGDSSDLITFLEKAKPRTPPYQGDEWTDFERSLYRMVLHAWRMRKENGDEWRQVGRVIRDAAVFVVEME